MKKLKYDSIKRFIGMQHWNNRIHNKEQNIEQQEETKGQNIYLKEYYKAKNTKTYKKLNLNIKDYFEHAKPKNLKIKDMLNTYNKSNNLKKRNEAKKETEMNADKTEKKQCKEVKTTKKEEIKQFKDSIKISSNEKLELDKAFIEFEKALKERKEYEKELKEKGAREVKARRNSGLEK